MKNRIFTFFVLILASGVSAQQNGHSSNDGHNHGTAPAIANVVPVEDKLTLKETEHDFEKIPQGKPVYYSFTITNNGKTPMKLDDVHASCGCTTPEWSREAIAAGASAQIKVGYNAAAEGAFEKFITITYNSTQTKQIKIKGIVWKAPEGSAPANASVDYLKKQSF
ncbi:MAG: DUF1573 domain-containing protein [Bacteroidota bacterium]|nr:DUF1573 domain-containing protein [Bacteroidota bacterium]